MDYENHRKKLMDNYPSIIDLACKARKRIPKVAWEYLESGTGNENLVKKNLESFKNITFTPRFCKGKLHPNIKTTLLGQNFSAPFGMAPVGLAGLMWPKAEQILAKTAQTYQIPFTLSTVGTETPEAIGSIVGNMGWFQLYPPKRKEIRKALLQRVREAGFKTLIVTIDVPTPSRRERSKRAGLKVPPKITPGLIWDGIIHPQWTIETLKNGLPKLRTVSQYSDKNKIRSVNDFVEKELGGNLSWEHCKEIRDEWDGPIMLKGLLHPKDVENAIKIGMDGIVVSNHGGRQFDGAPVVIDVLPEITKVAKGKIAIVMDSGVRSGLDIMRALHLGAEFVLLGRSFIYGVAALGKLGGDHTTEILMEDLKNNMIQLGVDSLNKL